MVGWLWALLDVLLAGSFIAAIWVEALRNGSGSTSGGGGGAAEADAPRGAASAGAAAEGRGHSGTGGPARGLSPVRGRGTSSPVAPAKKWGTVASKPVGCA